jgi:hypothetical protein
MSEPAMSEFAREDVLAVLASFGIAAARRVVGTDRSEEVIMLRSRDFRHIEPSAVAMAVMNVLPHTKVWVIEEHPAWESEPI